MKEIIEKNNMTAIMTRTEDTGLYSDSDSNKKRTDMRNRAELAKNSDADILVSIHMNSYTSPDVCGAQVFYYGNSDNGEQLAKSIQAEVSKVSTLNSKRTAKANSSYYILKNVEMPAVIVECGFLSNKEEAAMLKEDFYQKKLAEAIYKGITNYLER